LVASSPQLNAIDRWLTVVGGCRVVANVTAGLSRHLQEPSEHEKLVRELLPDDVADSYLELIALGGRPAEAVDQELVDRQLAYRNAIRTRCCCVRSIR